MFKKCVKCKRAFPEYMVEDYPKLHLSPLCPLCALPMINKLHRKPEETPFTNRDQQELYSEANEFITTHVKGNWGGHMINPPLDCKWRRVVPDGGEWVDLGNCQVSCKDRCARYHMFCRMSADERLDELFDNGVVSA